MMNFAGISLNFFGFRELICDVFLTMLLLFHQVYTIAKHPSKTAYSIGCKRRIFWLLSAATLSPLI